MPICCPVTDYFLSFREFISDYIITRIKKTLIKAFSCAKIAAWSAFLCDFLRFLPEAFRATLI